MNRNFCCEPKYVPGALRVPRKHPCPYQEPYVPNHKPTKALCNQKPDKITLRTQVLPASLGTDEEGQPYEPKPGAFYDMIVVYLANGAIYIYDSNGVPTNVEPANYAELVETVNGFQTAIDELYRPTTIAHIVQHFTDLEGIDPTTIAVGEMVLVKQDETHQNQQSLYYWSPAAKTYVYAYEASPYYKKEYVDAQDALLQQHIDEEAATREEEDTAIRAALQAETEAREAADQEEKTAREAADAAEQAAREQADTELQNKIDQETSDREAEDEAIQRRIDDIVNSPDVRFIVDTHADLEALDKSGVGDKDYARVLQDETHDGASTYYQFSLADQEWTYIGMTGPYYTKAEVDDKLATKQDNLVGEGEGQNLKTVNGESLLGEGNIELPKVELLDAYQETPEAGVAYSATYTNSRLNGNFVTIGTNASSTVGSGANNRGVAIGRGATATSNGTLNESIAIGVGTQSPHQDTTALGAYANATEGGIYSVALGAYSYTKNNRQEVSVGGSNTIPTRFIANVQAGENDTDAVNVAQLKEAVGDVEAVLATINTGEGV